MAFLSRRLRGCFLVGVVCVAVSAAAVSSDHASPLAPWTFHEDFSQGIPAWLSFPLAQDVGYDPSLYTTQIGGQPVLVRDVVAVGERRLHVGLLRPLRFHASSGSRVHFRCAISLGGTFARFTLTLGGVDGRRYSFGLPARAGDHDVSVSGKDLGIGAGGADIEVVAIEAIVQTPALGSHTRIILSSFEVDGERVPTIPVVAPRMLSSAGGEQISSEAITPDTRLTLQTAAGAGASTATLFTPGGTKRMSLPLPAGMPTVVQLGDDPPSGLWRVDISSEKGRSEFRFLLLGKTPHHPLVLFGAKRLEQLVTDPALQPVRELVHREAEHLAKSIGFQVEAGDNIMALSPESVFSGLVPYFTLMDSYANAIGYNALDYRLNGNPQGLEVSRRALLAVAAWPTWTPPWFAAHGLHTYYEAGIFTQRVAFGYDLIADDLNGAERSRIAESFWKNEIDPAVQEYFVNDRVPIAATNHMAHTVGGALAATLALAGDVPDWNTKFAPAAGELLVAYDNLLRGLFPNDGSEAEPGGYENFAMQGMSWGAASLDAFGIHPQRLGAMLDSFQWLKYIEVRPDLLLDTGDFDGTLRALSGFAWPAEYSRNEALRDLYERSDHALSHASKLEDTGRVLESEPTFLDLACCSWAKQRMADPPMSRIFAGRGSAVLRSGWGEDDTVISLRTGAWFNHEHHDEGSFQVAALGEKLIGEAGYSNYYTDPRYANYFTQAPGHNVLVLDDDPFSQQAFQGRYWPSLGRHPRIRRHLFSPGIDYVEADLADAYDGTLRSYTREYLFIKPDVLMVRDRAVAPEAHRFTFLLHAATGARATTDADGARIAGNHAEALVTSNEGKWTTIAEPIPVTAFGDLDRGVVQQRSALSLKSGRESSATFLVGMRFAKPADSVEPLRVLHERNAAGFSLSGDAQAMAKFRSGTGELTAGEFSTDGDVIASTVHDGKTEVFAGAARTLRRRNVTFFSAATPVDLSMSTAGGREEFTVVTERAVLAKFSNAQPAQTVVLDGKSLPYSRSREISIRLDAGEHIVTIVR